MKAFSKILTVIVTTVGAVGAAGGAVMLGVGGGLPSVKVGSTDNSGTLSTQGVGLLNYSSIGGTMLMSKVDTNFTDLPTYTQVMEAIKTMPEAKKDELTAQKALLEKTLETAKDTLNNAKTEFERQIAQATINLTEIEIGNFNTIFNFIPMYNLAIAGAVVAGVGVLVSILSAFMAMRVESSEEKKIAKKNKASTI